MKVTVSLGNVGGRPFRVNQDVPAEEFAKWAGKVGQMVEVTFIPDDPPHWGSIVYQFDAVVESVAVGLEE